MSAVDFPPAFLVIAVLAASAALAFMRLPANAGEELSGRRVSRSELADQRS